MSDNKAAAPSVPEEENVVLAPDYALKKVIGEDVDLKQIFSEENIAKAQSTIDKHKENFLDWVVKDTALLDEAYNKASADMAACEPHIAEVEKIAASIQSTAGTFGYNLATLVAKQLAKFCLAHPAPNADHMVVIRKHIDTLLVIFSKKITGDGGVIGTELLDNLVKLINKYK